jgi:hypothetical protein
MKSIKYNKQRCYSLNQISGAGRRVSESDKTIDNTGQKRDNLSRTLKRHNTLQAIGQDPHIGFRVEAETMGRETSSYLDGLARSVNEGKRVDEASNFCRWLRFSGVLKFISSTNCEADAGELNAKLETILHQCGEIYKGGRVLPKYDSSDIAAINAKLDYLLAKDSLPVVVEVSAPVYASPVALKRLPAGRC